MGTLKVPEKYINNFLAEYSLSLLSECILFQVFEVNASSKRAGKQILTQLQEATQSHQVSKKNLEEVYTSFLSNSGSRNSDLFISIKQFNIV